MVEGRGVDDVVLATSVKFVACPVLGNRACSCL